MRIISPFHDYYDCLQDGSDSNIFIRKPRIEIIKNPITIPDVWLGYEPRFVVGFCGKLYPFEVFDGLWNIENGVRLSSKDVIFDIDAIIQKEEEITKQSSSFRYRRYRPDHYSNRIRQKFDALKNSTLIDVFEKFHTPVFRAKIVHSGIVHLQINCPLKDIFFGRIFNTQLAFQEIEMYLFGVLTNNENKIPPVSNDDMIEAKGFDKRYSFRKDKSKR